MRIIQPPEFARALRNAEAPYDDPHSRGRGIILTGAGCSASAGIPLGDEIVRYAVKKLANQRRHDPRFDLSGDWVKRDRADSTESKKALEWLVEKGVFPTERNITKDTAWGDLYGTIFADFFSSPDQQRELIQAAIEQGAGRINWAHLCLGELVARKFIHTVLTTNFDQLALQGMLAAGVLPAVADGVEALARVSDHPRTPQLVQIHGSMHAYSLRNSQRATKDTADDLQVQGMVYSLLKSVNFLLVIGYRGNEEGVMQLLQKAADKLPELTVYWVCRDPSEAKLSPAAKKLLTTGQNKFLIPGQDADGFFATVFASANIDAPGCVLSPLARLRDEAVSYCGGDNPEANRLISGCRALLADAATQVGKDANARLMEAAAALHLKGHYREALRVLQTPELEGKRCSDRDYMNVRGTYAYDCGLRLAAPEFLLDAIKWWGKLVDNSIDSVERAETLNQLGNALSSLGDREGSPVKLVEAVAAYRVALEVRTKERMPVEWAMTQNNLGTALQSLGEREGSSEKLSEAVAAYRAALEVRTQQQMPVEWAMTQSNLGNALRALGEREGSPVKLVEAVAAYRAALVVRTKEQMPVEWAMTHNNLGTALRALGEREGSLEKLSEAVAAYRAALEVRTKEQMPVDWAMTQNNLGNALNTLGEREGSSEKLAEAVAAYRAALEVSTKEQMPVNWAMTQNNLGTALSALCEREGSPEKLAEAVAAYRAALEVRTKEQMPMDWATTQNNLGNTLRAQGERESSPEKLAEAVAAFRAALVVFDEKETNFYWRIVTRNLEWAQDMIKKLSAPKASKGSSPRSTPNPPRAPRRRAR